MKTQQDLERTWLQSILQAHQNQPGALLPILHDVQDALGFIPDWAVADVAKALNQSRAEVHGVITFYHHFRTAPPAQNTLQICQAEACQARGSRALTAHAEQVLGCSLHGKSAEASVGLEPVYCLGLCSTGPNIQLNDKLVSRVDAAKLDCLLATLYPSPAPRPTDELASSSGSAARVSDPRNPASAPLTGEGDEERQGRVFNTKEAP